MKKMICFFALILLTAVRSTEAPTAVQVQVETLKYIDDHGARKEAILDAVVANVLQGTRYVLWTHDPVWSVINQGGPYDWLTYTGKDGGIWQTKIHAETAGNGFNFWFESKHPGEPNGRNGSFLVMDWDGRPQEIVGLIAPDTYRGMGVDEKRRVYFVIEPR